MSTDSYLKTLYPFLHGSGAGEESSDAGSAATARPGTRQARLLNLVRHQATDTVAVLDAFFGAKTEALIDAARAMAGVFRRQGRLFVIGNGASHGIAAQLEIAFQCPPDTHRTPLPVTHLGTDPGLLTALAGGTGPTRAYSRLLQAHARRGDGLIGLSLEGRDQDLVAAFEQGHAIGMTSVALVGSDGGELARSPRIDHCLVVENEQAGPVLACHLTTVHILHGLVTALLADDTAPSTGGPAVA